MTKAKFLEAFAEKHKECGYAPNKHDEEAAVYAAEAAGVVWDPEPVTLPERITIGVSGLHLAAGYNYWAQLETPDYHTVPMSTRKAIATEVVARYNAWPLVTKAYEHLEHTDLASSEKLRLSASKSRDCLLHAIQRGAEVPAAAYGTIVVPAYPVLVLEVRPGGECFLSVNRLGPTGPVSLGGAKAWLGFAVSNATR